MTPAARRALHAAVVAGLALPGVLVIGGALTDRLGANPVETLTHVTGEWALRCLLLCLVVTPARRWLKQPALAPYRRSFGLLAFGYACVHFGIFLVLDLGLDPSALLEEIVERPYVTAGFGSLLLMTPLAITSTRGWQRRLGRRWPRLHRLVYVAACLAVVHFLWLVKADLTAPLVYAAVLAVLLALRLKARNAERPAPAAR
jgi:sulfoxide reductase heme-binding subunit YedZ